MAPVSSNYDSDWLCRSIYLINALKRHKKCGFILNGSRRLKGFFQPYLIPIQGSHIEVISQICDTKLGIHTICKKNTVHDYTIRYNGKSLIAKYNDKIEASGFNKWTLFGRYDLWKTIHLYVSGGIHKNSFSPFLIRALILRQLIKRDTTR